MKLLLNIPLIYGCELHGCESIYSIKLKKVSVSIGKCLYCCFSAAVGANRIYLYSFFSYGLLSIFNY